MTLRVVIVDDEDLIRSGLRIIIDSEPDLTVVGEAADGASALTVVRETRPDVVLMDVRMSAVDPRPLASDHGRSSPDGDGSSALTAIDGIQATRRLVSLPEPPKVVVVTTFGNDDYVYEALRAGASGFLLKRTRPAELVQAVRTVAAGDSLLFPSAIRSLVALHGVGGATPGVDRLTSREGDVLRLMARGLSNGEIAAELVVSMETVKTHVSNVLAKLEARDRTQAVIAAYESGFVSPR
ncbi:response regulator transcription factor [Streptosporangium carneum]|nr:response regulator transcription factor [Streptosporangium carneum]